MTLALWACDRLQAETAAQTLRTMCENIRDHPSELRYRRVREAGSAFSSKVRSCPAALDILKRLGFERVRYPDGHYWTLRTVKASTLDEAILELTAGLKALDRVKTVVPVEIATATEHAISLPSPQIGTDADAVHRLRPHHAVPNPESTQRQLQARAIVHRIKSRTEEERRKQRRRAATYATCAAAAAVLFAAGLALATETQAIPS